MIEQLLLLWIFVLPAIFQELLSKLGQMLFLSHN